VKVVQHFSYLQFRDFPSAIRSTVVARRRARVSAAFAPASFSTAELPHGLIARRVAEQGFPAAEVEGAVDLEGLEPAQDAPGRTHPSHLATARPAP